MSITLNNPTSIDTMQKMLDNTCPVEVDYNKDTPDLSILTFEYDLHCSVMQIKAYKKDGLWIILSCEITSKFE
jgi:hypothetical protein